MADKLNFSKPEELRDWLKDKPSAWAQIISWRAAMRAALALGCLKDADILDSAKRNLTLAVYRALLISSVVRNWPTKDIKAAAAAAARAADAAAYAAYAYADAAANAARASAAAARATDAYAARAADAISYAAHAAYGVLRSESVWSAVLGDADFLDSNKTLDQVARTSIWPPKQPKELTGLWEDHKQYSPDFAPWFAWYEAAAAGNLFGYFGKELSRKIALQPKEWWERSAEAVNADIKAWVEEQKPTQVENRRLNLQDILPHFSTDDNTRLDDRLGVGNDARIFARLLAARETKLPLAVGLFGPWGGGKSFFMKLMRQEMDALDGKDGYHRAAAHIEFNAWHYVDSDLWASLGLRIFEGVAEHLGGKSENSVAVERRNLGATIESNKQIKADADAAITAALTARNVAEAEIAQKQTVRAQQAGATLLNKLFGREFNGELEKLAAATGVAAPKDLAALEEALTQARRVADGWGKFAPGWLLRLSPWWRYPALIGAALGAAWAAPHWASLQQLLLDWIKIQVEPLTVAAPTAVAWTIWLNQRLATVRDLPDKLDEFVKRARAAYAAEPANNLATLDAEIAALRIRADNAAAEIETAAQRLRRAESGMLLYDHLTERARDGRYVDRQGVVAVLRRDLEHLKDYLGALDPDTAKISRIILYIDDLDRCEPSRVVEVLQAVHLLLAFPLFAVVVAVDPRWLERSLYDKYLPDHRALDEDKLAKEDFSPRNYLEKIFQIPFRLDPKLNGFADMVDHLTTHMVAAPADSKIITQEKTPRQPSAAGQAVAEDEKTAETRPETTASSDAPQASKETDKQEEQQKPAPPARLTLTPDEVEALKQVQPFIPTPRAVKRMLNVYLLVRLRDEKATEDPVAVMTLLGLEIGFPAAGRKLLQAIDKTGKDDEMPLADFAMKALKAPESDPLIDALSKAAPDVTVTRARPWLAAAFCFSFDPPDAALSTDTPMT